ncbi:MAG: cupin domain-containing protein [Spirochaetia bacterium]|nr:cupin domain-containing protein [Spirochaetia bacterium]
MVDYYTIQNKSRLIDSKEALSDFVKNLLLRNYKIYDIFQTNGELIPYHSHSYKEQIIILKGQIRMIVEENIIDLHAGDIITIEPWAIHLASFPSKEGARYYLCYPQKSKK